MLLPFDAVPRKERPHRDPRACWFTKRSSTRAYRRPSRS